MYLKQHLSINKICRSNKTSTDSATISNYKRWIGSHANANFSLLHCTQELIECTEFFAE